MNVIVFGYGNISVRHIKNLFALAPVKRLDIVRSRKVDIIECYDAVVSVYDSVSHLIDSMNYDLAIICSPSSCHFEHLELCINRRIPCLVEKPISSSKAEALMLLSVHKNNPVPIELGYDLRFTKGYREISALMSKQVIGEIWKLSVEVGQYLPSWRPGKDYRNCVSAKKSLGGGALRELSHEIDYLIGLFDFTPTSCVSTLDNHKLLDMDCENSAQVIGNASIKGQSAPCSYYISLDMLSIVTKRKLTIKGSHLEVEWDLINQSISWSNGKSTFSQCVKEDSNDPYIELMRSMLSRIEKQNMSNDALQQGHAVMNIIEEIENENRSG